MNDDELEQRLTRISTVWTLVREAHDGEGDQRRAAQGRLLERYQRAAYRYLLHALRDDANGADDLFQDFALRFLRGDFRNADPGRGRFRDYLRTVLINLVNDYYKRRQGRPVELGSEAEAVGAPSDLDDEFLRQWRNELLQSAWAALAQEEERGGPVDFAALRARCEAPDATSQELADRLNRARNPQLPLTEAGFRKLLQRARERFGVLLLEEVGRSIQTNDRAEVEAELRELGLLAQCRRALGLAETSG